MSTPSLNEALQAFEATEANFGKLEDLWKKIQEHIPARGFSFGTPDGYDDLCRQFALVLKAMPAIDGHRIENCLLDYDQISQMRFDAQEVDDVDCYVNTEKHIFQQTSKLEEYRFLLRVKRKELVRKRLIQLVDIFDDLLKTIGAEIPPELEENQKVSSASWANLLEANAEIITLIGKEEKPDKWDYLQRHLHFGLVCDYKDIVRNDWPKVKASILSVTYGKHDPLPVAVDDLGKLVDTQPKGPAISKLHWDNLTDEEFERLLFVLISETDGYENPEWLQQTRAADKGRDLSVTRVYCDKLSKTRRERLIIQCKHWLSRSVNDSEVATLILQMKHWEPPRIDELIIATSGRFSGDAVQSIEKHNQGDNAMSIAMWPESHLELLLASRPHLIAQFKLRQVLSTK